MLVALNCHFFVILCPKFFLFYISVFSENVVRLRSSMVDMSVSSDLSLLNRVQAMFTSEFGVVVVSVLLLHFAGFFVG